MNGRRAGQHGMCGLNLIVDFFDDDVNRETLRQGVGFTILGFNASWICHRTYEQYSRVYNIVYQSPVRRNTRSGNDFFFAVFDTRRPKVQ
jgi:hypothetical protein